jgi:hypothetical protein
MLKALKETPNQFSDLSRIECSYIDDSVDLSQKLISRLYDPKGKSKRCHIDLNKLRVKLATVKNSTLVSLPPSEDTFKQYVLRSSYQMHIFQSQQLGHLLSMVGKMESLVLNQYCLKVKCHLTFCRTLYAHAREDQFIVKVVLVLNRICPTLNFVLPKH